MNFLGFFRVGHSGARAALIVGLIACSQPLKLGAADPPPEPPLIGTAPNPSGWVITVQQKKALQPPADPKAAALYLRIAKGLPRMVRVEVDKAGANRREITFWEDKRTTSLFIRDGIVIFQPMTWPTDQVMAVPINNHLSPIKGGIKSDFADFDWVRPAVYLGRQSRGGQECFYYEDKQHAPLEGGNSMLPPVPGVRAWIEVRTRLPLAAEDDAVLKTYAYHQTSVNVELPTVFAAAYKNAIAANELAKSRKE